MDTKQLKEEDLRLRIEYSKLYEEQSTFRPKIGEDLITEIRTFLKELASNGPVVVEFREDYDWLTMSYSQWRHYLLDRGIELGDLPFIFPSPQGQLKSLKDREGVPISDMVL